MDRTAYQAIVAEANAPQAREASIQYLAEHLGKFLRVGEHVLICFQRHEEGNVSWLMEQAVLRCNAIPHVWGQDKRWKGLLRQAFSTKSSVIIGAPLLVLGLTKLARAYSTPLFIRKVITAGYPCLDWMIDGIVKGFDCVMGGCFTLGMTGVITGFACGRSWGVHIREDVYGVDIVDEDGQLLPDGELGEMVLYSKKNPEIRFPMGEFARRVTEPCPCGSHTARLMDFIPGKTHDPSLLPLGQELQSWTSILDCQLKKGTYGLEMDIVAFQGEKLPKLPTAAKLKLQYLDIERDEPFFYDPSLENPAMRHKKD